MGAAETAGAEMTTVVRWMSKAEYETMSASGQMVEGAGGQTFVATGGPSAFNAAAKGSFYAEFQVPTNSLLQGVKSGWFKAMRPNAGKAMQNALQKQGGQLLPKVENLSPILKVK
ncbi:TreTu family toxin [Pedobacter terrae]|uniref:TreTu family toxin n=1 Tax=Pedobacter terrae TaxID=405671 RepID=UPI002FFA1AC5